MHLYMDVWKFEIARRVVGTSGRFFKICLVMHRYVFFASEIDFRSDIVCGCFDGEVRDECLNPKLS